MNEQVLKDLYDRAVSKGYQKSIEEFNTLLQSNENVLADNYGYVQEKGYQKSLEDFSVLVGVKKKEDSVSASQQVVTDSTIPQQQEEVISSESITLEEPSEYTVVQDTKPSTQNKGYEPISLEKSTAIERVFGKNELTDLFGDIYRAGAAGQAQGGSVDEALELFAKGSDVSDDDIQEFIAAQKRMQSMGESDEMRDFQEIYQENGGGWLGFVKGVAKNPTVIPQLFVSSVSAMATPAVLAGAAGGAAGGALVGGPAGALIGAMGMAGTTLETGLTYAELLQEQLGDKPMTTENIRTVLGDKEAMDEIRFKAVGRGITIGTIDAITGGLAGKLTTSVVKSTGRKLLGATAGGTVEAVGGSAGEVAGRLVAGQEMDVAEIGFEGIAGTATAPLTVGYGLYKAPKYHINGKDKNAAVSGPDMARFIREANPNDLIKAEVNIVNDDVLQAEYTKKYQEAVTKRDISEADPEMNQPTLDAITELQVELNNLKGKDNQVAKDRAKVIREEIKNLQENPLTEETDAIQEPSAETVDVQEQPGVSEGVREGDTAITAVTEEVTQEEVQEQDVSPELQSEVDKAIADEQLDLTELDQAITEEAATEQAVTEEPIAEEVAPEETVTEEATPELTEQEEVQKMIEDVTEEYEGEIETIQEEIAIEKGNTKAGVDELKQLIKETKENKDLTLTQRLSELENLREQLSEFKEDQKNQLDIYKEDIKEKKREMRSEIIFNKKEIKRSRKLADKSPKFRLRDEVESQVDESEVAISNKEQVNSLIDKVDSNKQQIINSAVKAVNTLKSVLPNFDIIIHDTTDSYNSKMAKVNGNENSRGNFSYSINENGDFVGSIDINLTNASARTVAHEVTHAVLLKSFGEAPATFLKFKNKISEIIKSDDNVALQEFADLYDRDVAPEEYITELTAMLAEKGTKISPSTLQKIGALINELVSKITNGKLKPFEELSNINELADFFNTVSQAIAEGDVIDSDGVTEKINVDATPNETEVDTGSLTSKSSLIQDLGLTRFKEMSSRIKTGVTIKDIGEVESHLTFADRLVTGKVGTEDYLGGILFAAATGNVWASFKLSKVNSIIKGMPKNKDGFRYLMPALLTEPSHMSNKNMVMTSLKLMNDSIKNKSISAKDADDRISKALNKKSLVGLKEVYDSEMKGKSVNEKNVSDSVNKAVLGSKSTFDLRKSFLGSLLGEANIRTALKFGDLPSYSELANGLAEPITNGHDYGDVLLTIKTDGDLVAVQPKEGDADYHPSYPWVIRSVMPDGSKAKVETLIFKNSYSAVDLFPQVTNKKGQTLTYDDYIAKYGKERAKSRYLGYIGGSVMSTTLTEVVKTDVKGKSKIKSKAQKKAETSSKGKVKSFVEKARGLGYSNEAIGELLKQRGVDNNTIAEVLAVEKEAAAKPEVTEELVPGYDRLAKEVEGVIEKSKKRNQKRKARGEELVDIFDNVIEYVKGSRVYETATDSVREKLLRDIRKQFGLKEKTAPTPSKLLGVIRDVKKVTLKETELLKIRLQEAVKAAKDAKNFIADTQQALAAEVKALIKKGTLTQKQASAILKKFAKTDVTKSKSVDAFTDYVAKVFNDSEGKYKKGVINQILTFVGKKSEKALTDSNKVRGKGLDAQGQQFFAAAKRVLKRILEDDFNAELMGEKFFPNIDEILSEEGKLTVKEQNELDAYVAFETFKGIESMSVQEVEALFNDLKEVRSESIARLKDKLDAQKAEIRKLRDEVDSDIKEGYSELYNEDGNLLTKENLNSDQTERGAALRSGKLGKAFKLYLDAFPITNPGKFLTGIANNLKHLGTLTNGLDKVGKFFTRNIHESLNVMESLYAKGLQSTRAKMDEIASSIDGINSYKDIKAKLATGTHKIDGITVTIKEKGKKVRKRPLGTNLFNADQLMRIYALSKNSVQRAKLINQGFTEDKLKRIEGILGKDVVEFTDKVVEYLSTEYFEKTNDVYSDVNNVNLSYVENYFPTQTVPTTVNSDLLMDGNFNNIFNTQTAPALKERVDIKGDIEITNADFTDAIENHFETIERYKAYAKGVKTLDAIFKFKSVNTLLEQTGLNKVVKNAVNYAVNPNGGQQSIQPTIIDRLMTKYTGFALAFKLAQVVKQSTSFVNAFEDYSYRGEGKSKVPGLDLVMFMMEAAYTAATLPIQIQKAYNMSPMFKERVRKGLEGDVFGLETGSVTFKPIGKSNTMLGKAVRAFKTGAGSPTVLGDILGVMGYMINYNRDIANGMSEADALKKFENYNATQQSRRATEKIPLQMNSNSLVRGFTMFGSTLFLQMNKVMQGFTNVMRSASKGEVPTAKDTRAVILNLGVANVMFALAANLAKFIKGDDEDRDEALLRMKDAMSGLNLIYQAPYFGASIEEAVNKSRGIYRPADAVVNPFKSLPRKFNKLSKDDNKIESAVRVLVELTIGAQLDPFVGLFNGFTEGFDEDVMYDVLGVSSSYRPAKQTESKKGISKSALKKANPRAYQRLYGPGSAYYKQQQRIKELKRRQGK